LRSDLRGDQPGGRHQLRLVRPPHPLPVAANPRPRRGRGQGEGEVQQLSATRSVAAASEEWRPAPYAQRGNVLGSLAPLFRSSPVGGTCALLLLGLVAVAIFAERLAPHNPLTANYAITRDPPFGRHVLGTDHLGRDVLSRVIFGARVTLLVAISSVLLGDSI